MTNNNIQIKLHHSLLFQTYGSLLTSKQQTYFQLYVDEDLSLNEISTDYQISKAAVSDSINKTIKTLENFEEKLHLLAKNQALQAIIEKYQNSVENGISDIINELKELI